jgi:hypothetical protein
MAHASNLAITSFSLLDLLIIWAALVIALVIFTTGQAGKGGALTLAYFFGLSLIHVPGVLPFLVPGSGLTDRDETQLGFELTILGLAAFVPGAVLARRISRRSTAAEGAPSHRRAQTFRYLGWRAIALGVVIYFVLLPLCARVESLTSLVAPLATLMIVGFWLVLYAAAVAADWRRTLATLALLPLLPLATMVTGGFMGYGTYWVLSIIAFLFVVSRQRIWFYVAAPPVVFLGLSVFVTYMIERQAIREFVWDPRVGLFDRLDRASSIVTEFELFDLDSPIHLAILDSRLNQNYLVGAAVIYHEIGAASFAYGGTAPLWAFIPRAVWPDKPQIGGGRSVVTDFTGIRFAEDVSVGAGQVLEFYVNFGLPGVLIGFFGFGYLLMWLDQGIMRSLAASDARGLLLRAIPGLALLQPGGNLLELIVGGFAACITACLVVWLRFFAIPSTAQSTRWLAQVR